MVEGNTRNVTIVRGAAADTLPAVTVNWRYSSTLSDSDVAMGEDVQSDSTGSIAFGANDKEGNFSVTALTTTSIFGARQAPALQRVPAATVSDSLLLFFQTALLCTRSRLWTTPRTTSPV